MPAAEETPWLDIYEHTQVNQYLTQQTYSIKIIYVNTPIELFNLMGAIVS